MTNKRLFELFDSVFPAVFGLLFVAALLVPNRQRDNCRSLHLEMVVITMIEAFILTMFTYQCWRRLRVNPRIAS
jgi:hypothetical protein